MNDKDLTKLFCKIAREQSAKFAAACFNITNWDAFVAKPDSIEVNKKFASAMADSLNFYLKTPTEAEAICRKIASTPDDQWTEVEENVTNIICNEFTKVAAQIKTAGPMLPLMLISKSLPMALAATIPATGFGAGAVSHLIEKEMNEDDVKAERIKAKIRRYKVQAARLNKSILGKHGIKTEDKENSSKE